MTVGAGGGFAPGTQIADSVSFPSTHESFGGIFCLALISLVEGYLTTALGHDLLSTARSSNKLLNPTHLNQTMLGLLSPLLDRDT